MCSAYSRSRSSNTRLARCRSVSPMSCLPVSVALGMSGQLDNYAHSCTRVDLRMQSGAVLAPLEALNQRVEQITVDPLAHRIHAGLTQELAHVFELVVSVLPHRYSVLVHVYQFHQWPLS